MQAPVLRASALRPAAAARGVASARASAAAPRSAAATGCGALRAGGALQPQLRGAPWARTSADGASAAQQRARSRRALPPRASSVPAADAPASAEDVRQGRLLLTAVGASYGAAQRPCRRFLAPRALYLSPRGSRRSPATAPLTRARAQARWPPRCASSSCCPARRCVPPAPAALSAPLPPNRALMLFAPPHAAPPAQSAACLSAVRGVMAAMCFLPYVWNVRRTLPEQPRAFWLAASELALWNFLSQGLLNIALLYTDAMRVSFIAQTAIVLTPLIAAAAGQAVRKTVWFGCLLALCGVGLLASDGGGTAAAAASSPGFRLSLGDALALGGAATSSLYIYRIGEMGKQGLSSDLTQAVKVALIGALYCVWAAVDGARLISSGAASGWAAALWPGWRSGLAWLVLAYSALVPGALADVLQARGQKKVSAAEAQVLLGAEPLWTAVLGMALLGERLGAPGWAGAGLIVLAVLLASGAADLIWQRKGGATAAA